MTKEDPWLRLRDVDDIGAKALSNSTAFGGMLLNHADLAKSKQRCLLMTTTLVTIHKDVRGSGVTPGAGHGVGGIVDPLDSIRVVLHRHVVREASEDGTLPAIVMANIGFSKLLMVTRGN